METTEKHITIPQHVLCFRLEQEVFAVDVIKVIEIMEVPKISKIPKAPQYMSGVINVRGFMVPLVDTRVKLGMQPTEFSIDTCVVVTEINTNGERLAVGILVDEVYEVLDLAVEAIRPAPRFETNEYEKFITGMFTKDKNYAMILNLDEVFSLHEIIELESVTMPEKEAEKKSQVKVDQSSKSSKSKKTTTKKSTSNSKKKN